MANGTLCAIGHDRDGVLKFMLDYIYNGGGNVRASCVRATGEFGYCMVHFETESDDKMQDLLAPASLRGLELEIFGVAFDSATTVFGHPTANLEADEEESWFPFFYVEWKVRPQLLYGFAQGLAEFGIDIVQHDAIVAAGGGEGDSLRQGLRLRVPQAFFEKFGKGVAEQEICEFIEKCARNAGVTGELDVRPLADGRELERSFVAGVSRQTCHPRRYLYILLYCQSQRGFLYQLMKRIRYLNDPEGKSVGSVLGVRLALREICRNGPFLLVFEPLSKEGEDRLGYLTEELNRDVAIPWVPEFDQAGRTYCSMLETLVYQTHQALCGQDVRRALGYMYLDNGGPSTLFAHATESPLPPWYRRAMTDHFVHVVAKLQRDTAIPGDMLKLVEAIEAITDVAKTEIAKDFPVLQGGSVSIAELDGWSKPDGETSFRVGLIIEYKNDARGQGSPKAGDVIHGVSSHITNVAMSMGWRRVM